MPNWREVSDISIEFVTGKPVDRERRHGSSRPSSLPTSSTRPASRLPSATQWREILDGHDRKARGLIDQYLGRVVKSTGDGLLAVFDTPSQGVNCGVQMCDELAGVGIDIRAGIHAGEIEVHDDGDVSGVAVNLAARVEQHAADRELWASSTVRDLMLGGDTSFTNRGEHELKGIDGNWHLFAVIAS